MNWGFKITAVFVSFTLLIGFLVYKSVHTKIDLVSTDYYKEELRFQKQIDGTHNANLLSAVKVEQTDSSIAIQFPNELRGTNLEGEAWFYCA
ncbi:MAG: FixH family protein, partial [Bacteroidota bacterium]|nr:FixH family protein [Bacteroidota bacterium]